MGYSDDDQRMPPHMRVGGQVYGYHALSDGYGELAPSQFDWRGAEVRVSLLSRLINANGQPSVYLRLSHELPDDYALRVARYTLVFETASRPPAAAEYTYQWDDVQLDWTEGQTVEVLIGYFPIETGEGVARITVPVSVQLAMINDALAEARARHAALLASLCPSAARDATGSRTDEQAQQAREALAALDARITQLEELFGPADAAEPSLAGFGLDAFGLTSYSGPDTSACVLLALMSGRGATALWHWGGDNWALYATTVKGAIVPGAMDFDVTAGDVLFISNNHR